MVFPKTDLHSEVSNILSLQQQQTFAVSSATQMEFGQASNVSHSRSLIVFLHYNFVRAMRLR
jgi:hypothetical protein